MCAVLHTVLPAIGLYTDAGGTGCSSGVECPGPWLDMLPELIALTPPLCQDRRGPDARFNS